MHPSIMEAPISCYAECDDHASTPSQKHASGLKAGRLWTDGLLRKPAENRTQKQARPPRTGIIGEQKKKAPDAQHKRSTAWTDNNKYHMETANEVGAGKIMGEHQEHKPHVRLKRATHLTPTSLRKQRDYNLTRDQQRPQTSRDKKRKEDRRCDITAEPHNQTTSGNAHIDYGSTNEVRYIINTKTFLDVQRQTTKS